MLKIPIIVLSVFLLFPINNEKEVAERFINNKDIFLFKNDSSILIEGINILSLNDSIVEFRFTSNSNYLKLGVITAKCEYPDMDPDVIDGLDGMALPAYKYMAYLHNLTIDLCIPFLDYNQSVKDKVFLRIYSKNSEYLGLSEGVWLPIEKN